MDGGEDERSDNGLANEFLGGVNEVEGGISPQKHGERVSVGGGERGSENGRQEL